MRPRSEVGAFNGQLGREHMKSNLNASPRPSRAGSLARKAFVLDQGLNAQVLEASGGTEALKLVATASRNCVHVPKRLGRQLDDLPKLST
jgi:hypothetical protein